MPDQDKPEPIHYEQLEIGERFIPVCFESEKLQFRKDADGRGGEIGVCLRFGSRSQYFASLAPVYRIEAPLTPPTAPVAPAEQTVPPAGNDEVHPPGQ
ncbi:MAG: hypothetical protein NT069_22100 [Planctomycetota bacterium]|nr:hypothetical protein [Planctomycetota bacterium]